MASAMNPASSAPTVSRLLGIQLAGGVEPPVVPSHAIPWWWIVLLGAFLVGGLFALLR
jgi:hypothetical protein